jgi:hypothetical protein
LHVGRLTATSPASILAQNPPSLLVSRDRLLFWCATTVDTQIITLMNQNHSINQFFGHNKLCHRLSARAGRHAWSCPAEGCLGGLDAAHRA